MSSSPLVCYIDSALLSPYSLSVVVSLREKGLSFTLKTLDLSKGETHHGEYANNSLSERIPAIVHGDFWLSESSAIDEYLEDAFPAPQYPSLYPSSIILRARARQIQAWLRSDLLPIREERSTSTLFVPGKKASAPLSSSAKLAVDRLIKATESLIKPGQLYLFGAWSIVDTDLALMLNRLLHNGDPLPEHLASYVRYQWARESVQSWVQSPR